MDGRNKNLLGNILGNENAAESALLARRLELCAAAAEVLLQSIESRRGDIINGVSPFVVDGKVMSEQFGSSVSEMLEELTLARDAALEVADLGYELAVMEVLPDTEQLDDSSDYTAPQANVA